MVYRCSNFGIKELVSPIVYNKWGEQAWMFFSPGILKELDLIRETYGKPIIINNWASGGNLRQCGLRSNLDQIVMDKTKSGVLYLSRHTLSTAFDLHCGHGHNRALWDHCYSMIKSHKLHLFNQLENHTITITKNGEWVHIHSSNSDTIVF